MSLTDTDLVVHVRYNGTSSEIAFSELFRSDRLQRIGVDSDKVSSLSDLSDTQLKQLLAGYFDKPASEFNGFVLERESTGNLTLRPEAVFGFNR